VTLVTAQINKQSYSCKYIEEYKVLNSLFEFFNHY
jgi:hypothetical protein